MGACGGSVVFVVLFSAKLRCISTIIAFNSLISSLSLLAAPTTADAWSVWLCIDGGRPAEEDRLGYGLTGRDTGLLCGRASSGPFGLRGLGSNCLGPFSTS